MSTGELLDIQPQELRVPFELMKQISCLLQLSNKTDNYLAFKFNKESGLHIEECKLRVVYVAPPRPPSSVREIPEEDSSPRVLVSENGHANASEYAAASRAFNKGVEPQDSSSEARADLISRLTVEKNSAIQQNTKLQQELEFLKRDLSRSRGGIPFIYVIIVGLFGIILGYLLKM